MERCFWDQTPHPHKKGHFAIKIVACYGTLPCFPWTFCKCYVKQIAIINLGIGHLRIFSYDIHAWYFPFLLGLFGLKTYTVLKPTNIKYRGILL